MGQSLAGRSCAAWLLILAMGVPGAEPHGQGSASGQPIRIGTMAPERPDLPLSPLTYGTGFLPKALAYETLVRIGPDGALAPGLARAWQPHDGGRRWTFQLRENARFADGSRADALAVVTHVHRWLDDPRHAWVGAAERIVSVRAEAPTVVVFALDRPYPLPLDLALLNPTAIAGPPLRNGAPPSGSGSYELADVDPWRGLRALPTGTGPELQLRPVAPHGDHLGALVLALRAGHVDLIADDWRPRIPRTGLWPLITAEDMALVQAPGSAVSTLLFQVDRPPFDDRRWRAQVAAAVDRLELVAEAEHGFADPVSTVFGPAADWPDRPLLGPVDAGETPEPFVGTVDFLVEQDRPGRVRSGALLARRLRALGLDVRLVPATSEEAALRLASGDWHLRIERTWGLPYDPHATLTARFAAPRSGTAVQTPPWFYSPLLDEAVLAARDVVDREQRRAAWALVQRRIEQLVAVVPLYATRQLALQRPGITGFRFGTTPYRPDLSALRRSSEDAAAR